jgi:hypothetical protein
MGELLFAGDWVVAPFGGFVSDRVLRLGANPDMWLEVVPGTILRASIDGFAVVAKNPPLVIPEDDVFESQERDTHSVRRRGRGSLFPLAGVLPRD